MASESFANISPKMGKGTGSLRFALNMTSRGGKLVRRPAIRAVEVGGSTAKFSTGTSYPTGRGDAITNYAPVSEVYDGISFAGLNDTTMTGDLNLTHTAEHPINGAGSTVAVRLHAFNMIEEGIDIELISGKLVCLYLSRKVSGSSDPDGSKVYLGWSWHMPSDPRFGTHHSENGSSTINFFVGGKYITDTYIGNESQHNYTGFNTTQLHAYTMGQYWERRIHRRTNSFMFTGKNVGTSMVTGDIISTPTIQNNVISDGIVEWSNDQLLAMGPPSNITTDANGHIPRTDDFNSIYVGHSPKNAFAHGERRGQTLWYGFNDGDQFALSATLPTDDVLHDVPSYDISGDRLTVTVRKSSVWYSEIDSPVSLSGAGATTIKSGENSSEVIGLAEYGRGTVVFTRNTIHYLQGVGAWLEGDATREALHQGVGADSRWSIKEVGGGVAFANKDGLHYLDKSNRLIKQDAFDELFEDGVFLERGPYDSLRGITLEGDSDDGLINDVVDADTYPWAHYKVDKQRLDRAVGVVWEDLYILFVSRTEDDAGDDNRMGLVWNWKENTHTVWLMPKNMGVRGWAYDGSLATPFVMTRHGVAMFDPSASQDERWVHATSRGTRNTITKNVPIPVVGQSHHFPAIGDSFVSSRAIIEHTFKYDDAVDTNAPGAGSAYAMHIQMWTQTSELSVGKSTPNVNDISFSKNLVLASLFNGGFLSWSKANETTGSFHYKSGSSSNKSYRINGPLVRTSVGRSGGHSVRHRVQFYTLNHSDINSIQVGIVRVSPKGRRG